MDVEGGLVPRADRLRLPRSRSCSRASAQSNRDAVSGWGLRPRPLGVAGSSAMNSAQENGVLHAPPSGLPLRWHRVLCVTLVRLPTDHLRPADELGQCGLVVAGLTTNSQRISHIDQDIEADDYQRRRIGDVVQQAHHEQVLLWAWTLRVAAGRTCLCLLASRQ